MLEVRGLCAEIEGNPVLKGIDLKVGRGEVHAIMGPNGAGKSSFAKALTGHPACTVTAGEVKLDGKDLLPLDVQGRALAGLFLGFQYPVEVPGVNNAQFLRMALNARRKHFEQEEYDAFDFDVMLDERMKELGMDPVFKERMLNSGYSGGEKKKNEILQMAVLEPKLALLDETDSGLDIDALRVVSNGINRMRGADRAIILITHYQRLLDYVKPDRVHVLAEGRIARSGGPHLAVELEEHGYDWLKG